MRADLHLRVLLVLGLLGVAASACVGGSRSPSEPRGDVVFHTLLQTAVPGQSGGEIRAVVRDRTAWAQLWSQLREGSSLPTTPPDVDFGTDMVIVAAMATQPCVSQVTIRAITRDAGGLRVDVLEEPPAANCICIVSQRPIHAVRLGRSNASVQFTVTSKPRAC